MTDDFVLSFLLSAFSLEIANFAEKKKDYIIIEHKSKKNSLNRLHTKEIRLRYSRQKY